MLLEIIIFNMYNVIYKKEAIIILLELAMEWIRFYWSFNFFGVCVNCLFLYIFFYYAINLFFDF